MSTGEYVIGSAWLLAVLGIAALGARASRRVLCPGWDGPPARLAEAVSGIGLLVVVAEVAGLFGAFDRRGVLAGLLLATALLLALERRRAEGIASPGTLSVAPVAGLARALALAAAVVTAVIWVTPTVHSLAVGMYLQDSTWYHLSFSAHFFQSGETGSILYTDPLRVAAWFYPQNSELLHAIGMVGMRSDVLSPLVNACWMALTLLAAWCIGRPVGRAPLVTIAVGTLLATDLMSRQAGNAPSDIPGIFFLLAAIALLLNGSVRPPAPELSTSPRREVALRPLSTGPGLLTGLAAGLAVGTKVTLIPAVAVIAIGAVVLAGRGARLRALATWAAGLGLGGSFWYLRNLFIAGNPVPWVGLHGLLPTPDQLQLYPRPPNSVLHYLGSPGVWWDWFFPGFHDTMGPAWPLLLVACAAGVLLALAGRANPIMRVIALAAVAGALAYVVIPIGAPGTEGAPFGFQSNLRYLAPSLFLAVVLLALGVPRPRKMGAALELGAAMAFLVVACGSRSWAEGHLGEALIVMALAVAFVVAGRSAIAEWRWRAPATAVMAVLVAATGVAGLFVSRGYLQDRYRYELMPLEDSPGFRSSEEWRPIQDWGRRMTGKTIGVVGPSGGFGQYVLSGADLSNRVRYVGAPSGGGTFRPIDTCAGWRYALNHGRFDFVVITPPDAEQPGVEPEETYWTRTDSATVAMISHPPTTVFRIRGKLDVAACNQLPSQMVMSSGDISAPGSVAGVPGLGGPGGDGLPFAAPAPPVR